MKVFLVVDLVLAAHEIKVRSGNGMEQIRADNSWNIRANVGFAQSQPEREGLRRACPPKAGLPTEGGRRPYNANAPGKKPGACLAWGHPRHSEGTSDRPAAAHSPARRTLAPATGDLPRSSDPRILAQSLHKLMDPSATKGFQVMMMVYKDLEPTNELPEELKRDPRLFLQAIGHINELQNADPHHRWPSPLHQERFGKKK